MLAWRIAQRLIVRVISFGLTGGFTLALVGMAFGMVVGIAFCALYYAGALLNGSTAFAEWFLFVILPSGGCGVVGLFSGCVSCALAACLTARVRESEGALGDIVEGALTGAARGLAVGALCGVSTLALIFFIVLHNYLLPSLAYGMIVGAAGGVFVGSLIGAVRAAQHHRF